jgi:hypothetical protein
MIAAPANFHRALLSPTHGDARTVQCRFGELVIVSPEFGIMGCLDEMPSERTGAILPVAMMRSAPRGG